LNGSSGFYLEAGAKWVDPGAKVKDSTTQGAFGPRHTFIDIYPAAADITLNGAQEIWDPDDAQIGDWRFAYRSTNSFGMEFELERLAIYG
jgi:hypothetical protein